MAALASALALLAACGDTGGVKVAVTDAPLPPGPLPPPTLSGTVRLGGGDELRVVVPEGAIVANIAGVGDVNGDDLPDIAVAYGTPRRAGSLNCADLVLERREVAIVFGRRAGGQVTLPASAQDALVIRGANSSFGVALAPAGDVNDDGLADIAIGDPPADPKSFLTAGDDPSRLPGFEVVLGRRTGGVVDLAEDRGRGFRVVDPQGDPWFGVMLAGGGDYDGDGDPDILVGGLGRSGVDALVISDLDRPERGLRLTARDQVPARPPGEDVRETLLGGRLRAACLAGRRNVSGEVAIPRARFVGDLDGDGRDEVALRAEARGQSSIVLRGGAQRPGARPTGDEQIASVSDHDPNAPSAAPILVGAGDADGDGHDDLLALRGPPRRPRSAGERGLVISQRRASATVARRVLTGGLVVPGAPTDLARPSTLATRIPGLPVTNGDAVGLGDQDGDGKADVAIAVAGVTVPGGGAVWIRPGNSSADLLDDTVGIRIEGAADDPAIGWIVEDAGDMDGDGRHDPLIAADRTATVTWSRPVADPSRARLTATIPVDLDGAAIAGLASSRHGVWVVSTTSRIALIDITVLSRSSPQYAIDAPPLLVNPGRDDAPALTVVTLDGPHRWDAVSIAPCPGSATGEPSPRPAEGCPPSLSTGLPLDGMPNLAPPDPPRPVEAFGELWVPTTRGIYALADDGAGEARRIGLDRANVQSVAATADAIWATDTRGGVWTIDPASGRAERQATDLCQPDTCRSTGSRTTVFTLAADATRVWAWDGQHVYDAATGRRGPAIGTDLDAELIATRNGPVLVDLYAGLVVPIDPDALHPAGRPLRLPPSSLATRDERRRIDNPNPLLDDPNPILDAHDALWLGRDGVDRIEITATPGATT